ncbi:Neutral ceramidase precursor [Maioricimonas rarisocia]|uniref:Neutral ceramidase n=1 Tax=Maioricimonas rarisocia TaxID=2528026 RepID=A0A517Z6T4_9PLAN|nr:neutral/alkaline non-lysosomal ceramidase N-terminal domain-containing protein [Maioricimonas rarisocia]QDU38200.1 Neutral ceramidase precursor [Maioricimonas rarisocia]
MSLRCTVLITALLATFVTSTATVQAGFQAGFARADITPTEPVRLSGYGNRDHGHEGVDHPLYVRATALKADDGPVHILVSVDTIGFPGTLTKEIFETLRQSIDLERRHLVIAYTHSHTAPHIVPGLSNLFAVPLSAEERENGERYTRLVRDTVVETVKQAVANLSPARLFYGVGEATFAQNRRVLKDGTWTGFGINPNGPVDHTLPLLRITDASGENTRGLLFNYACHCTTFGGDYYRVNGDWAGYASQMLEESFPDAVALCTIGCGADANPHRPGGDKALAAAKAQGEEIADEVRELVETDLREITAAPQAAFGFAGLPVDRPSLETLRENLKSPRPQVRQHAENMIATHERMGRLPETYPMPIHVWRFGDEFAMVFLGGEVCVDYALRIKRELKDHPVWVTAYANDVFGYVAPERMQSEGGYEVDYSMIYYNQPGRWSSGTEDVILRRIHELYDNRQLDRPLSVDEAIETFSLPDGYVIEPVATEPLIRDPVNFTIDESGRLWVVEMGDYPRGDPTKKAEGEQGGQPWDGPPGGRVKVLTDRDSDGQYDEATIFLDGLTFPTGVFPWRDGVIVTSSPEILFAKDTDGDDVADETEVLYSGFVESNPQHRVNGFDYGLDNWLYLASGAPSGEILCTKTGDKVNISGRDLRIQPDTGVLETLSGRSQYGRCRDLWNRWFGNTNSRPLFQFVVEDGDLRRNPYVAAPTATVHLTTPAGAPPVYPTSRTIDRFNDLHAANRFTSACAPHAVRDDRFGAVGSVFICEPVHNLVSRVVTHPDGIPLEGARHPDETDSEFLSSSDNWFRPVRMLTAPDGSVWLCDMYRHVIEHPQWIPEAWQAKIDLYAGFNRGRIWRIRRADRTAEAAPDLTSLTSAGLVKELASPNGWRRDTAQRLLIARDAADSDVIAAVEKIITSADDPRVQAQAAWTLAALKPSALDLSLLLESDVPEAVVAGVQIARSQKALQPQLMQTGLAEHDDIRVRFAVALAMGDLPADQRAATLKRLAVADHANSWMRAAILSSSLGVADELLAAVLRQADDSSSRSNLVSGLIATALADNAARGLTEILATISPTGDDVEFWQIQALATCVDTLSRRNVTLSKLAADGEGDLAQALAGATPIFAAARDTAQNEKDDAASRAVAVRLLGQGVSGQKQDRDILEELLSPRTTPPVQTAAIQALARMGAVDVMLEQFGQLTPSSRREVLATLLTRQEWTRLLLAALEAGDLSTGDIDASTREALTNHTEAGIKAAAQALLATSGNSDRADVVAQYLGKVPEAGDAARGRGVFEKRCATCHQHGGVGKDVGAKLSAIKTPSREVLLTAILDPNRAVEAKYSGYVIQTEDGRVHTGMIVEENATSVTLARPDGQRTTILRLDIEEMRGTGRSFMPEGLEKDLSPQDLADVMAFVQEMRE